MLNILDIIKVDHKHMESLFEKIEKTTERTLKTRDEAFQELLSELESHSFAEERILYQAIITKKPSRRLVLESIEEHLLMQSLLESLRKLNNYDERWMAQIAVLKSIFLTHTAREERDLFTKARGIFNARELVDLGVKMREMKSSSSNPLYKQGA